MPDLRLGPTFKDAHGIVHAIYIGSKKSRIEFKTTRYLLCTDENLHRLHTQRGGVVNCIECIASIGRGL